MYVLMMTTGHVGQPVAHCPCKDLTVCSYSVSDLVSVVVAVVVYALKSLCSKVNCCRFLGGKTD